MSLFKKRKSDKKHHGVLILFLFILGLTFYPNYPTVISLQGTVFLCVILSIILVLFIWLVRRVTNHEKVFATRLSLDRKERGLAVVLVLYFLFLYLMNGNIQSGLNVFRSPMKILLSCVFIAIGAGCFEEYFVRGYLFNLVQRMLNRYQVKQHRLTIIAVVTSFLFCLLHLANLADEPAEAVAQQVVYTFAIGMIFVTLRIVSNQIWPLAIAHFLFDLQDNIVQPLVVGSWMEMLVSFLPSVILSLFLLFYLDRSVEEKQATVLQPWA